MIAAVIIIYLSHENCDKLHMIFRQKIQRFSLEMIDETHLKMYTIYFSTFIMSSSSGTLKYFYLSVIKLTGEYKMISASKFSRK